MTKQEYFQQLEKKNKLSAAFFLAGAAAVLLITIFFILVLALLMGALQAVIYGTLGSRAAGDGAQAFYETARSFWLFVVFAAVAIVPQIIAGVAILKKLPWARTAGIVAFFVALVTFTPVALLLIYPLVFLLGNDGKYLYKSLIKNNLE